MADRAAQAAVFLATAGWADAGRLPLDASPRRYERLRLGSEARVLMDADPARGEDVAAFTRVGRWLLANGFSAPVIHAEDPALGFLLLEDLGDALLARLVEANPACTEPLYAEAAAMLVALHKVSPPDWLPGYDPAHLADLVALTADWYLRLLGRAAVDPAGLVSATSEAARRLLSGPKVLCLRDCHAENLLWLPERDGVARVGLLDFQDAFLGHPAYDLVSLLQDARRDLAPEIEAAAIADFCFAAGADPQPFAAAYAFLGAQRSLRILGIFARLALRDGKPQYLAHIPRLWSYLRRDLAHPALADLARAVFAALPPFEGRKV